MIEVNNIYMRFEGKEVLTNINTSFIPGKINMVIGSSGSGKTVLLKCIVGLLHPSKGEIIYDGRNFTQMNYYEKKDIRHEIGMLFQGGALFNSLTVEENVGFPLKMFTKKSAKEISDRVDFCLDRVNLHKVNKLFPSEISGGMQKRVGIARAIVMNPRYMFCDEPNSGLDPKTSRVIDELIREITAEFKTTTIVNSHDMASVFAIADKVLFIHKGQKWWEGTAKEIKNSENAELLQMIEASGQEMEDEI
jgi:phospholipid/cholesterol/gamma-HCH transport system ATP-binding protein